MCDCDKVMNYWNATLSIILHKFAPVINNTKLRVDFAHFRVKNDVT